jgi:hypothetical protein
LPYMSSTTWFPADTCKGLSLSTEGQLAWEGSELKPLCASRVVQPVPSQALCWRSICLLARVGGGRRPRLARSVRRKLLINFN